MTRAGALAEVRPKPQVKVQSDGEWLRAMCGRKEVGRVRVREPEGEDHILITQLSVDDGAPIQTVLCLVRAARDIWTSSDKRAILSVDAGENFGRLVRLYVKMGAKPSGILLEVRRKTDG